MYVPECQDEVPTSNDRRSPGKSEKSHMAQGPVIFFKPRSDVYVCIGGMCFRTRFAAGIIFSAVNQNI